MRVYFRRISPIRALSPGVAWQVVLAVVLLTAGTPDGMLSQEAIPFDHLTVADGLSQGTINCILQDSRGFMWFGTQDGLNRYDGYEFRIYKNDPEDTTSIGGVWPVSIAEDSAGTLWVGTLDVPGIYFRFDRDTEGFARVSADSVDLRGARISSAFQSYSDPAGYLWSGAGSEGGGLTRTDLRSGATKVFRHSDGDPRSLIDDRVYAVTADAAGTIWVATRGGLDRFDQKSETFTHFTHDDRDPGSLSSSFTWSLLVDAGGNLWIGTYEGGLNRYDPATGSFAHFRHDESNPRSLAGDLVQSLYQDASGMIWVGLGEKGVDRFHPGLLNFTHYLHDPSDPNSLSDNTILSMCVDRAGMVWIGTPGGLDRWDRSRGRFRLYSNVPADPASLGENQVTVMLEDRAGNFWVGLNNRGLDRLDRSTGRFTHYRKDPNNPRSLPDNGIGALLEDRRGNFWVGTYRGGLSRMNRETGEFTTYGHDPENPSSLAADGVWALLEDREGVLWVGTLGGGLDRFDPEAGTFTHFPHDGSDPASLSNDIVVVLHEDRRGQIWVGTAGGLNRFDRRSGTFRRYLVKDGLPNDVIVGILEDNEGDLWFSTNGGLARFDQETGEFRTFNYSDGLQGDEFNQFAFAKDPRSGELFFGGPNGFNVFDPLKIRTNTFVPPVVFSSFTRYNTDDEEGTPIVERGIDAKSHITLSYKDNVANFEFAALNYFNTFKNRYAYNLEGYTDNWIQLGPERRATFTNLDGGDYVLRVRGSNNDGLWNEEGVALSITVTPPWWKTNWAYGSYVLMIVAVLYGLRKEDLRRREQKAKMREAELRNKAMEAEKRALEAENERKTKELEDARNLQLSMLPKKIPEVPGYEISVFMKTATEVGGDYYDFSVSPEGELNVAFGDATGHGMQAGTIVTLMKGLFLSEVSKYEIDSFFNHCSRAIKDIKLGRLYMALTLARFRGKDVSLSSAGMPPAYLHRKADDSVEEILLKAVPLGSMRNFPYHLYQTSMEEGDTLLLMTDGLPEQKNASDEMFDYARVMENFRATVAGKPEEIIQRLVKEGDGWMDTTPQEDDITLMVIRRNAA